MSRRQLSPFLLVVLTVLLLPSSVFTYLLDKNLKSWSELQKIDLAKIKTAHKAFDELSQHAQLTIRQDQSTRVEIQLKVEELLTTQNLFGHLPANLRPWYHLTTRVLPKLIERVVEVAQLGRPIFRQEYLRVPERVWMVQTAILLMQEDRARILEAASTTKDLPNEIKVVALILPELSKVIARLAEKLEITARTPRPAMDARSLDQDTMELLGLVAQSGEKIAAALPQAADSWLQEQSQQRRQSFLWATAAVALTLFLSLGIFIWLLKQNRHESESKEKDHVVSQLQERLQVSESHLQDIGQENQQLKNQLHQAKEQILETTAEFEKIRSSTSGGSSTSLGDSTSRVATQLSPSVKSARLRAEEGHTKIQELITDLLRMSSQGQAGSPHSAPANDFAQQLQTLASKIKIIDEIVMQAKLLSFNASIEASRAGQAGRGFSVVAEEIAKLALQCAEVAKDIRLFIHHGQTPQSLLSSRSPQTFQSSKTENPSVGEFSLARDLIPQLQGQRNILEILCLELKKVEHWSTDHLTPTAIGEGHHAVATPAAKGTKAAFTPAESMAAFERFSYLLRSLEDSLSTPTSGASATNLKAWPATGSD